MVNGLSWKSPVLLSYSKNSLSSELHTSLAESIDSINKRQFICNVNSSLNKALYKRGGHMEFRDYDVSSDLEFYVKGDINAFEDSFPGISLPTEMINEIKQGMKGISRELGVIGITAEIESEPIGFIVASIQYFYIVPFLQIDTIYVEHEFRGTGTAGELLGKVETWGKSQGAKFVQLDVTVGNDSAVNSYLKNGYVNTRNQMEKML